MASPADWSLDDALAEADEMIAEQEPSVDTTEPSVDLVERALALVLDTKSDAYKHELPFLLDKMTDEQKEQFQVRAQTATMGEMEESSDTGRKLAVLDLAREHGIKLLSPAQLEKLNVMPRDPLFVLKGDSAETVVAERDYGMVYAKRGTGKTMWSLGVGIALAGGAPVMHMRPMAPRRVMLVEGEMPLADMKARVASVMRSLTPQEQALAEQNFRLLSWEHHEDGIPSLAGPEGWCFVDRAVEAFDPALVILDNISCLAGSAAENDENEWKQVGDWAKSHRRLRSVVWVHHSGRAGTAARGTSKREDPMDFVIALRQPKGYEASDGACFEIVWEKARGRTGKAVETRTFKLNNDETDLGRICTWAEVSAEDTTSKNIALKESRLDPIARAILKGNPGITKRAFRAECRELYKEQHGEGIGQAAMDRVFDWLSGYGGEFHGKED